MVKLDIVSDPVCPWCYIGITTLNLALAERPDHPFTVEWHPFQLNPEMPPEGMERRAYLEAKFGGKEGAVEAYLPVVERAEALGLKIAFDLISRTPNTLNAHRLIHWAGIEGCQGPAAMALFRAYFEEGRDIGDLDVLADLADGLGLDAAVIRKLLHSDADLDAIRTRDAQFRQMGVTAVPTVIVAAEHAVPGAQPTELWVKVIDEIMERA